MRPLKLFCTLPDTLSQLQFPDTTSVEINNNTLGQMGAWHSCTVFWWKSHRDVKFSREFSACIRQKTKPYVCNGCFSPYLYIIWSGAILTYSNSLLCDTKPQGPQNEIWWTCEFHKQHAFLGAAEDLCWPTSSAAASPPWCLGQHSCHSLVPYATGLQKERSER